MSAGQGEGTLKLRISAERTGRVKDFTLDVYNGLKSTEWITASGKINEIY